ncbi:hypothetical protein HanIR_Chr03g0127001 [Helianthus annuus]|nr:hypothetical protein HanIR_Chr03g0127001 [Helianthus annuus]
MDSRIRLDYALFQLTPTRTRCDLIICAGDCKEKLTSGLLEPFVSHLKFAKDEASKGGYSITLSAPDSASWFTKSTLERFVRFVSTPEVLERFVTIENEIKHIDCSIKQQCIIRLTMSIYGLDEHFNKSTFSFKHEDNTTDTLHEEDPKFHLQRVLETRKAGTSKRASNGLRTRFSCRVRDRYPTRSHMFRGSVWISSFKGHMLKLHRIV